jgi:hypothetical protein
MPNQAISPLQSAADGNSALPPVAGLAVDPVDEMAA